MPKIVPPWVCKSSPLGVQKFPPRCASLFATGSLASGYRGKKSLVTIIYYYLSQCGSLKRGRLRKNSDKEKSLAPLEFCYPNKRGAQLQKANAKGEAFLYRNLAGCLCYG